MNKSVADIVNAIKNLKITSGVVICGFTIIWFQNNNYYMVAAALAAILLAMIVELRINQNNKKNNDNSEPEKKDCKIEFDYKNHHFFVKAQERLLHIRTMKICDNIDKALWIKDCIQIVYDLILKRLNSSLENRAIKCTGNCSFIVEETKKFIDDIVIIFREIKMPEMAIDKIIEFCQPHIDIFFSVSEGVCALRDKELCIEKVNIHLFNIEFLFEIILNDIKEVGNNFNGTLERKLQEIDYLGCRKPYVEKYNLIRIEDK